MTTEYVDVLSPPRFEPSGRVKTAYQAVTDGDWLGAMNLWIVRPGPALLYQQRPAGGWEPGKLDGSVGGYYRAGESGLDGLREAEEELGCQFSRQDITLLGRHLSVGVDSLQRERRVVVTVYMTFDNLPLTRFKLDPKEVPAIFEIQVADVLQAFDDPNFRFKAPGMNSAGKFIDGTFCSTDFSFVFGGYHRKVADIAKKFSMGERSFAY